MDIELRRLAVNDGIDIYEMLQEMPKDEDGFVNSVSGKSFDEFKQWLIRSDNVSKGIGIEDGKVPQNTYWLYINGNPVGFGKIRHYLTEKLEQEGGHIGYAIRPSCRNKRYGTLLLKLIIEEAKKMGIQKVLLTIRNCNNYSIKVALNNKGRIDKISDKRHYIWIDC